MINALENIIEWREVGQVRIRGFCQQYTSHSSLVLKKTLEGLEKEIIDMNLVGNGQWVAFF